MDDAPAAARLPRTLGQLLRAMRWRVPAHRAVLHPRYTTPSALDGHRLRVPMHDNKN